MKVRDERYSIPCGARDCDGCGQRWQQDRRVCAVAASEHLWGDVALITVTAPGSDYFGDGDWGLGDSADDRMADWNRSARRRWRLLYRDASKWARRHAYEHGGWFGLLYRAWEYQKRGALHVHIVVPMGTALEQRCTRRFFKELEARATAHGFGYCLNGNRRHKPWRGTRAPVATASASKAARYVCKYVASLGSGKDSMASVAQRTAKRGSVLYIAPRLSRQSGYTMKSLKARRRIWARYPWAREGRASWEAACHVDGLQRRRSPLDGRAIDVIRRKAAQSRPMRWLDITTGEVIEPTAAPSPMEFRDETLSKRPRASVEPVALAAVRVRVPISPTLGSVVTSIA